MRGDHPHPPTPAAAVRFEDGAAIVRERSAGLCEARRPGCTYVGSQTHHRQPRGMGGVDGIGLAVNRPSGLVRLCLACHTWIESERTRAEELGLLVRRPTPPAEVPVFLNSVHGRGWFTLTDEGNLTWLDLPEPDGSPLLRPGGPMVAVGKKSSGPGTYPLL